MKVDSRNAEQFVRDYKGEAFQLIFIDPPYAYETSDCEKLLQCIIDNGVASVKSDTLIVLERSTRSVLPKLPQGWEIFDNRHYGETAVLFIQSSSVE